VRRLRTTEGGDENGEEDSEAEGEAAEEPAVEEAYHEYVVLDFAGRLQLPREYLDALGITDRAQADLTPEGILIRPAVGLDSSTAQAARVSEVAETWGPQKRPTDWKLRLNDATRGLRGLLKPRRR
jgi:hypothetical protein